MLRRFGCKPISLRGCFGRKFLPEIIRELEVITEFPGDKAILLMPPGTVSIQNFPVKDVSMSRMGAAMAEGASRIASYRVKYAEGQTLMGPPDQADLLVPAVWKSLL